MDGVIDQDPLGVDQIYLQAKRYGAGNSVGPGDIRRCMKGCEGSLGSIRPN